MPKKIIIISDNHGMEKPIQDILNAYPEADYFFHLGDSEMPYQFLKGYARVRGNNDYDFDYPENLILEIDDHKFYLTHGHRDYVAFGLDTLIHKMRQEGCDIGCFGHTHRYFEAKADGLLLLNPGSIWHNRDGSKPSYMILTLGDKITVERKVYPIEKID
ncbi:MAG: metallophosphoesterase [Solobacterium sp.]|nr:metallophosphoesterase [Solobacterium sp.]